MNLVPDEKFKDPVWESSDRRKLPVRAIEDTHLANIIYHCRVLKYHPNIIFMFECEAQDRGLTPEFLARAPIPFRRVNGTWRTPDYTDVNDPLI